MSGGKFKKMFKHEQGRGNVDVSDEKNNGLYSKTSPGINAIDYYWMLKIGIKEVQLNLMKTA